MSIVESIGILPAAQEIEDLSGQSLVQPTHVSFSRESTGLSKQPRSAGQTWLNTSHISISSAACVTTARTNHFQAHTYSSTFTLSYILQICNF